MSWLLAGLAAIVAIGGARAAIRSRGVELNHVVLFSFGIAFYWILPVAAGLFRGLGDQPGFTLWYATWDLAERSGGLRAFLAVTLATYLAFLAGDWVGARAGPAESTPPRELSRDPRLLRVFLPFAVALVLMYAWVLRGQLFVGYRFAESAATGARGTLSAASILVLVLCLLRSAEVRRWPRARPGWLGVATDPFVMAYAASAVLVLSLGGRLYVVSAILMAIVYVSVFKRPLPLARTLAIGFAAMALSGAVGTMRLGYAPSPLGVLINVLAEPMFTGFSLLHFVGHNDVPLVTAPYLLLSDLMNLVPSAVLPTKSQYLLQASDVGYSVFSPLGAQNSYVSLAINFGMLGTPVAVFVLGIGLATLKRRQTALARVMYTMLAGWIPFTFFRDEFAISVIKNMFEFSVLIPALVVVSMHVMTVVAPRRGAAEYPHDGSPAAS